MKSSTTFGYLAVPRAGVAFSVFSPVDAVFSPVFRRSGVDIFNLNIYS